MNVFALKMGPDSKSTEIPFFQICEAKDSNALIVLQKTDEGYVRILHQKENEIVAFGASCKQVWAWDYTLDPSQASRFTTLEAARIFQDQCGGPRRGVAHSMILRPVGRPTESPSGKPRESTTLRIDPDLKAKAQAEKLKLGPLLEEAIQQKLSTAQFMMEPEADQP